MKCPSCGDEVRDGRCVFCGYRPTEADMRAAERYRQQKEAFASGPGTKAREKDRPGRDGSSGRKQPRAAQERKPLPEARPDRGRQKPKPEQKQEQPRGGKPGAAGGRRHGFLARLLFRLLIIGWILAWILALYGGFRNRQENEFGPGDFPYEGYPYEQETQRAGGGQEGGSDDA